MVTAKSIDRNISLHRKAQQYSDCMDAAERAYTDNVMPNDAEGARQLLSLLHDHKRAVLEASMHTLQEAQTLLGRLRNMTAEGATLDSRPLQIRTNIDFGEYCSCKIWCNVAKPFCAAVTRVLLGKGKGKNDKKRKRRKKKTTDLRRKRCANSFKTAQDLPY